MNDFNQHVLSDLISAFRKGYSCQSSLMKLCEEMRHAMDHSKLTTFILMDLSKAQDPMAGKLTDYGMFHYAIKLLVDWF